MKQITLQQSQELLLELAKVVCNIGYKHGIPVFMVGGTMLGSIRHQGFIPWDDDMDFGVTYDHYFELISVLKLELPKRYRCLCYEDNSPVHSFFFKVEDSYTVMDDPCFDIPLENKIGLSIDVFPIVSCSEKDGIDISAKIKKILDKEQLRIIPQNASLIKRMIKRVLGIFDFSNNLKEKRKIKALLDALPGGDKFCNITSPQFWRIIWPKEIFTELESYKFADTFFLGPANFDAYLTRCYKNYMQLPPEEKRRVHSIGVYKKEENVDKGVYDKR